MWSFPNVHFFFLKVNRFSWRAVRTSLKYVSWSFPLPCTKMSSLMLMAFLQSFIVSLDSFLDFTTGWRSTHHHSSVAVDSPWHSECVESFSSKVVFKLVEAVANVSNRETVTATKFMSQFRTYWHQLMGRVSVLTA